MIAAFVVAIVIAAVVGFFIGNGGFGGTITYHACQRTQC